MRRIRGYGSSGTLLAIKEKKLIVPVAHNAGYFWPRRGVLKKLFDLSFIRYVIHKLFPFA